ncbi:MAG TPA: cupredoxin domain-containing protein [Candidatus Limnocylindrales bacterium]|jgi:mono/diheme cytochrome c family protein/plastocyanin|nr:cupredoxin domain-containing protein [Candidatus Limnocylindrales bacterium]
MTDQPGRDPEQRLPATRPPSEPAPADRFSAPPASHKFELSPERAAKIVRQSANARWVGFLAVAITVLFVVIYYFYELGAPLGLSEARLEQEAKAQAVTEVERGYNLYQANCARCHGPDGLGPEEPSPPPGGGGYIGPKLHDQMKLFAHLSEGYLRNVLEVGGRYVCGNPNSAMPIWSDRNGGPLNYRQIEELIAFLRSNAEQEYEVRDPALNEPEIDPATGKVKTFHGWVDPNFQPEPGSTPFPDCYLDAVGGGEPSPGAGSPTPAPTLPPDATVLELTAANIAFDKTELEVSANEVFGIHFKVDDPGQTHDVDIRQTGGTTVVQSQPTIKDGEEITYVYEPLPAGDYQFFCSVHPFMSGTLTSR